MSRSAPALARLLRAGFDRAVPQIEQYQREIDDPPTARAAVTGRPWAGSARADAVLALAQPHYAQVGEAAWRDRATLEDWAVAYCHAHVLRGHDPLAARVLPRVEEEVRRRFEVDIRAAFLREHGGDVPDRSPAGPLPPDGRTAPPVDEPAHPATGPRGARAASERGAANEPMSETTSRSGASAVPTPAPAPPRARARPTADAAGPAAELEDAVVAACERQVRIAQLLLDELPPDVLASTRAVAEDRLASAAAALATARTRPAERAGAGEGRLPVLVYPDADAWVRSWLLPTWRRPLLRQRWCPEWWLHAEALSRFEALWRAWEHLRGEGALGPSVWWRDHADHHLAVLTGGRGPFAACSPDRGHRQTGDELPAVAHPVDLADVVGTTRRPG